MGGLSRCAAQATAVSMHSSGDVGSSVLPKYLDAQSEKIDRSNTNIDWSSISLTNKATKIKQDRR